MELFGIKLGKDKEEQKKGLTFVTPKGEDGAIEVEVNDSASSYAASIGYTFDISLWNSYSFS